MTIVFGKLRCLIFYLLVTVRPWFSVYIRWVQPRITNGALFALVLCDSSGLARFEITHRIASMTTPTIGPGPDHVPGTEHLIDIVGLGSAKGRASKADVVLIPRPSDDPNDPLNWSHGRKTLAVCMAYLYVFGTGIATSLQYSVSTLR